MNSWIQLPKDHDQCPTARWGHSICKINNQLIFLFGGYADSVYYNDIWVFDVKILKWKEVTCCSERKPQPRSNTSLVYNQKNNSIIIFGGGASGNSRFADIWEFIINESSFNNISGVWKKVQAEESSAIPWCRTYHSSEKFHNFLIIYGGQAFGSDLDDLWALNLNTFEWIQIKTVFKPPSRRFHSSAIIEDFLYVIGGCEGNYKCLKDIFRVNLSFLLNQSSKSLEVNWEEIHFEGDKSHLNRWGHSSCVDGQSIYIFGGRNVEDLNDLLCFQYDNMVKNFKLKKIDSYDKPVGRRKGVLTNIGSYLFLHGGYNNQYFSQVHLFNIFYAKELRHRQLNTKLDVSREFCDIHLTTRDKKIISMCTPLIQSAFYEADNRIQFLEELAEMDFREASIYQNILNNGFSQKDNYREKFLDSYKVSLEHCSLFTYKRRIMENILREFCSVSINPYIPIRVSEREFNRISEKLKNNPYNNIILYSNDGVTFKANSYLLSMRSTYMNLRFNSKKYKKKNHHYDLDLPKNILNMLLIYFQYGHLILDENIEVSEIIKLYDACDFYCLCQVEQICLEQLKRLIFNKCSKKDLEIIIEKASKEKKKQNWKILGKYSLGMLSSYQIKGDRGPLKNLLNRQIENIKDKLTKRSQYSVVEMMKRQPQFKKQFQQIQQMNRLLEKCKHIS